MRVNIIAGIALVIIGGFVMLDGAFTTRRAILSFGDVSVLAHGALPVQPWAASLAVVAGIALVAAGLYGRSPHAT
jgi:hypothetical protein